VKVIIFGTVKANGLCGGGIGPRHGSAACFRNVYAGAYNSRPRISKVVAERQWRVVPEMQVPKR
jgi:hypothetical protein